VPVSMPRAKPGDSSPGRCRFETEPGGAKEVQRIFRAYGAHAPHAPHALKPQTWSSAEKLPSSEESRQIQPKIVGFTRTVVKFIGSVLIIIVKSSSSRESYQIQQKIVRFSLLARKRHLCDIG
jgi:hypothetical protein